MTTTLADRVARLEAWAGIATMMQDYADAADRKYTPQRSRAPVAEVAAAARAQADCFTPDGAWSGGRFGGDLTGRAAIAAFFETSPWLFTSHHYGSMAIRLDPALPCGSVGARATVRWRLLEIGVPDTGAGVALLVGAVRQDCRLTDEGWRIARMSFERLHSLTLATEAAALRCLIPAGETP